MQLRDWSLRAGRWRYAPIRGPLLALVARRGLSPASLQAHLDRVRAARSSGGLYGLKLHAHHLTRHFPDGDVEARLGPIRWIYVTREDTLGQAISWARAQQTGAWASWQRPDLPPVYSRRRIVRCLAQIHEGEATWEAHFAARGVRPLRLRYEQLAVDLQGAVRAALEWLGVPGAEAVDVPPPRLKRQADGVSSAWRARFEAGR
jgi:LPS sulfotransferase NodH